MTAQDPAPDRYDRAYAAGYRAGLAGLPYSPPRSTIATANEDGKFKREQEIGS